MRAERLLLAGALLVLLTGAGPEAPRRTKVFLIGLDGATWTRMLPLMREGRLPFLERMVAEGASGPLLCNVHGFSPNIWTTIATGKTPEEHGIDFDRFEERPYSSRLRKVKALWNIASDAGMSVDLVGYLVTWPAEPVQGVVVTDQALAPEMGDTLYPPGALKDYGTLAAWPLESPQAAAAVRRFVAFDFDPAFARSLKPGSPEYSDQDRVSNHLAKVHMRDESWVRISEHLLGRGLPDFYAIHLWGIDSASHAFWKYSDSGGPREVSDEDRRRFGQAIDRYYEYADEVVGRLMRFADRDTQVLVVSDHGFEASDEEAAPGQAEPNSGKHEVHGVMLAWGPRIARGAVVARATVLDVTPTVLDLLGLPVAKDMPGHVLSPVLAPGDLERHPTAWIGSYEGGPAVTKAPVPEAPRLPPQELERLRSLGYLK